jgi:hypothetical protein
MIIMSLRGALFATKQSPITQENCFATARNHMWGKVNAQSAMKELRRMRTLMSSVLNKAFKSER